MIGLEKRGPGMGGREWGAGKGGQDTVEYDSTINNHFITDTDEVHSAIISQNKIHLNRAKDTPFFDM